MMAEQTRAALIEDVCKALAAPDPPHEAEFIRACTGYVTSLFLPIRPLNDQDRESLSDLGVQWVTNDIEMALVANLCSAASTIIWKRHTAALEPGASDEETAMFGSCLLNRAFEITWHVLRAAETVSVGRDPEVALRKFLVTPEGSQVMTDVGLRLGLDSTTEYRLVILAGSSRSRALPGAAVPGLALIGSVAGILHTDVVATPAPHAATVIEAELADDVDERLRNAVRQGVPVLWAFSGAGEGLHALPSLYRKASRLVWVAQGVGAPAGAVDARRYAAHVLLSRAEPHTAQAFAKEVLEGILAAPPSKRARSLAVLQAATVTDGTADEVATHLSTSTKNVRVRRRQVEQLTGLSLAEPGDALLLQSATILGSLFSGGDCL